MALRSCRVATGRACRVAPLMWVFSGAFVGSAAVDPVWSLLPA